MKGSNFEGDHSGSESYSMKKKSSTNFAWNLGAGVGYAFTDNISLDVGYRFTGVGEGETKNTDTSGTSHHPGKTFEKWKTDDLYIHQVMAGLRFTF
jgi:opacity protein-like surface antigen